AETRHRHSIAVSTALRERFQAVRAAGRCGTSGQTARVSSTACARRNGRSARTGPTRNSTVESNVGRGYMSAEERLDLAFQRHDDLSICTPSISQGATSTSLTGGELAAEDMAVVPGVFSSVSCNGQLQAALPRRSR